MKKITQYFHPLVWIILSGTIFVRTATFMVIPFIALYLHNELHASPYMIGLTVGIAPLFSTFGGLIGGYLTDRFERKNVILATIFIWSFVFIGFAFAPSAWVFLCLNALNGLCRSFFEPGTQAMMIDYTEDSKKRRLFTVRYTAINIGAVIGPLLGVWISSLASSSLPFIITGIMYFIYGIFLTYILSMYPSKQVRLQQKATFPIILKTVFTNKTLGMLIVGGILISLGYSQFSSTLPQLIDLNVTHAVKIFSYVIVANSITVLALQFPLTMIMERTSIIRSLTVGISIFAIGLVLFNFSTTAWMFIVSMIIFSIGEVLTFPLMGSSLERIAPADQKAIYLGSGQLGQIGNFIGPVFGGWLIVHFVDGMYIVIAALMLCSIFFYYQAVGKPSYVKEEVPSV
jgi:MFS family permease